MVLISNCAVSSHISEEFPCTRISAGDIISSPWFRHTGCSSGVVSKVLAIVRKGTSFSIVAWSGTCLPPIVQSVFPDTFSIVLRILRFLDVSSGFSLQSFAAWCNTCAYFVYCTLQNEMHLIRRVFENDLMSVAVCSEQSVISTNRSASITECCASKQSCSDA